MAKKIPVPTIETTPFTLWKRCENDGTMNNNKNVRCRECGLFLLERTTTEDISPKEKPAEKNGG